MLGRSPSRNTGGVEVVHVREIRNEEGAYQVANRCECTEEPSKRRRYARRGIRRTRDTNDESVAAEGAEGAPFSGRACFESAE